MPNWNLLAEKTQSIEKEVIKTSSDWMSCHTDWTGWIVFSNYPPCFIGKYEILHINHLSDKRLAEIGELVTVLCNQFGMKGRRIRGEGNQVEYKLWLPIE